MADATPDPVPTGSRLLQDLGFPAFTRGQVEIIMPTRKPRGRALTRSPKAAKRRVTRCRMVHDTCRLRKAGVRDLSLEVGCALPHFRVRLTL